MPTKFYIVPRGLENAGDMFGGLRLEANRLMRKAMEDVLEQTVRVLTTYPPETERNFPPSYDDDRWWWYERGVGGWRMNRQWKPFFNKKNASEHLTDPGNWNRTITETGDGAIGTFSTQVSYAPYVFGSGARPQAWFHQEFWVSAEDIVEALRSETAQRRGVEPLQAHLVRAANSLIDYIERLDPTI